MVVGVVVKRAREKIVVEGGSCDSVLMCVLTGCYSESAVAV